MKRIMMLAVCVASLTVLGGEYDDYVTMTGGGFGHKSFSTGDGWPNNEEPQPGKKYYCPAGKTFWYGNWAEAPQENNVTFAGDELVMGGWFYLGGGAYTWIGFQKTVWLSGSSLRYYTSVNFIDTGTAEFEVKATAANPFRMSYSASTANVTRDWPIDFVSAADGYTKFDRPDGDTGAYGFDATLKGDWSRYYGTFEVAHSHCLIRATDMVMPGTFKLTAANARLKFSSSAATYTIGGLEAAAGAIIDVSNGAVPTFTTKFDLQPGAIVWHGLVTKVEKNYAAEKLLFRIAKGVELPDFEKISFVSKAGGSNSKGPIPKTYVRTAENGDYVEVYLVQRKVVYHEYNGLGTLYSLTIKEAWSDGELPTADKDYFFYRTPDGSKGAQVNFGGVTSPYVWTGGTMVMWDQYNDVMMYLTDITIGDLWLRDGASLRTTGWGTTYAVRGNLSIIGGSYGAVDLGHGNVVQLYSNLAGTGNFRTDFICTATSATSAPKAHDGTLRLWGDNSAFKGKLLLGFYGSSELPSDEKYLTMEAMNGTAFGGELAAFTYDAVSVSDECRLSVGADADFCAVNRGWYFADKTYLAVAAEKVAKARSTVTVNGELTKTGAGSVLFAAVAPEAESLAAKKLTVTEGSVGALTTTALDGVSLAFAAGAGLIVEAYPADATFAAKGFMYTDVSKLTSAGTITVTITGVADWTEDFVPFTVGICTVPTAQAATLAGKMRAKKPAKGIGAKIVTIDNGDDTTTIAANCDKFGMALVIR